LNRVSDRSILYFAIADAAIEEDRAEAAHDDPEHATIISGNELRVARNRRRAAVAEYHRNASLAA
jgi:hypothetical protein